MPGPDDQHMTWDRFKELGHRLFPGPVAPDQLPEHAAFEEQLAGLSQRYDHLKAEQDADDPLKPGMSTSAQLRNALAAAEHERDTAYDVVEGIERMRSTAMRERDEALDTLDHVSTLLAQAVKDRDRYRSNFAATLLQFDHLAAVAQALVQTVELWCDLGTPKNRQPIHEPWQKVRDVLASDADDYMRMVLTDDAKRYLEQTDSSTTEGGSVRRVARENREFGSDHTICFRVNGCAKCHSKDTDQTIRVIMESSEIAFESCIPNDVNSVAPKTSNVSDVETGGAR